MEMKRFLLLSCIALLIISLLPVAGVNAAPQIPNVTGDRVMEGGQRDFLWPVPSCFCLTSCFLDQRNHRSLDIDGETGDPVVASYAGKVIAIENAYADHEGTGWGNYVLLEHQYVNGETLYSRYSHLLDVSVEVGQTVAAGDRVGTIGTTGDSSGSHLDYEILLGGTAPGNGIDPYVNELLQLPPDFHTYGDANSCCSQYVAAVKEFYNPPHQCEYGENGVCIHCEKPYDWQSTAKYAQMGTYNVVEDVQIFSSPYDTQPVETLTAGQQKEVSALVTDHKGTVWCKIGTKGYVPLEKLEFAEYFAAEMSGSLTTIADGQEFPQSSHPLAGSVTSLYPLATINGYINDEPYASWWADDTAGEIRTVDLRGTNLNNELSFRSMQPGEYTLTIVTTDIHGNEKRVVSCTFRIVGEVIEPVPEPQLVSVTFVMAPENQLLILEPGQALGELPTPAATQEKMYFIGWYTALEGGEAVTAQTIATGDMNLYPRWVSEEFTREVTFDGEPMNVPVGTAITNLPIPTKEGYQFLGWFTASEGGQMVTEQTIITEPMALYSQWAPQQYTVTLDPGAGSVSHTQITVTYGESYGKLPMPTRDGYTFMGWKLGSAGITETILVRTAGDHTLVAAWQAETQSYIWLLPAGGLAVVAAFVVYHFVQNWRRERDRWSY